MGNSQSAWPLGFQRSVHPHGRGELSSRGESSGGVVGSSPRAWGTQGRTLQQDLQNRFIPTGVGNSVLAPSVHRSRPVHPHGRGELADGRRLGAERAGSSPRAWGTPFREARSRRCSRFIPTGVGNSYGINYGRRNSTVHPHGRGELSAAERKSQHGFGSSPRAWGTRACGLRHSVQLRFIPTGVGNSSICPTVSWSRPVHPHGRGELRDHDSKISQHRGSSPRAWGTLFANILQIRLRRFIPTGVGNSRISSSLVMLMTVHPHGRGELPLALLPACSLGGSSPRAWGTQFECELPHQRLRFIPTGVGNSVYSATSPSARPVHPHGRGELCSDDD